MGWGGQEAGPLDGQKYGQTGWSIVWPKPGRGGVAHAAAVRRVGVVKRVVNQVSNRQGQNLYDGAHVAGGDVAHEVVVRRVPIVGVLWGEGRVLALVQQHEELPVAVVKRRVVKRWSKFQYVACFRGEGRVLPLVQQLEELIACGNSVVKSISQEG